MHSYPLSFLRSRPVKSRATRAAIACSILARSPRGIARSCLSILSMRAVELLQALERFRGGHPGPLPPFREVNDRLPRFIRRLRADFHDDEDGFRAPDDPECLAGFDAVRHLRQIPPELLDGNVLLHTLEGTLKSTSIVHPNVGVHKGNAPSAILLSPYHSILFPCDKTARTLGANSRSRSPMTTSPFTRKCRRCSTGRRS